MSSRILNIIAEKSVSFDNIFFFLSLVNFTHGLLLLTSLQVAEDVYVVYSGKSQWTSICQVSWGQRDKNSKRQMTFQLRQETRLEGNIRTINFGTIERALKSPDVHSFTHSFIPLTGPNICTRYCAEYRGNNNEQDQVYTLWTLCVCSVWLVFCFPEPWMMSKI